MVDLHDEKLQLIALGAGVLLHVLAYRRGEWDLHVPKLLLGYGIFQAAVVAWDQLLNKDSHDSVVETLRAVVWLATCHVVGIVSSMLVYRVLFHRLGSFPGPFAARVSNFYLTRLTSKQLHLYNEIETLHNQYGDFVRVGPTELSVTDPNAIEAIYSGKSPCTKGPWYNIHHPRYPLNMTRDKAEHARRRKTWDRGLGTRALRDYEPRVANYTDRLLARIEATKGKPLNVTDWFNFYSFDVMGDLAFGRSFNMLRDGIKHYFMKVLHGDMTNVGYLSHLPWLFPFVKLAPGLNSEHLKFWKFCSGLVDDRIKMKPDRPDVFTWLLEDFQSSAQTTETRNNLEGDAYLIVVAGSDTTAATLTSLFFELARNKEQMANLRRELDPYFASEKIDYVSLSKLKHLDAVINEAMRLHPAVPSGVQRQTPPEGLLIGNTFIPGNTIMKVPLHTVFRDSRSFDRPLEFIPERWTTRPELTKDASVFTPFSTGPYSCIGKQLALMELRYVVAQIVHRYDVALAPGMTEKAFLDGKRDTFTLALGPLNLVFTDRK